MNKNTPEILQLRLDIEKNISRRMLTPYDFEFLAGAIWERLHENLSPSTLKRLWGYIDDASTARTTTLSLLAQFLGFGDWDAYLADLAIRSDIESRTFVGDGVRTSDLKQGECVEVSWLPNRTCVFRYLGHHKFEVIQSVNAKLNVGDTFTCIHFFKGQPMYLDNLGPEALSYVAGSKSGLTKVNVVETLE